MIMQCLKPLNIPRPGGKGPADRIQVPCGKCEACLANRSQQWVFRLNQEAKQSVISHFITLTYADEYLYRNDNGVPSVNKRHVQLFFKRLRHCAPDSKLRYFLVSEYGPETFRPHYHFLLFGWPDCVDLDKSLSLCWPSFHTIGLVTPARIQYCANYYIQKATAPPGADPNFSLCSRNPGIGANYITPKSEEWHKQDTGDRYYCVLPGGSKVSMPRYYQEKLFDEVSRERHNVEVQKEMSSRPYGVPRPNYDDFVFPQSDGPVGLLQREAERQFLEASRKFERYVESKKFDYARKIQNRIKKKKL